MKRYAWTLVLGLWMLTPVSALAQSPGPLPSIPSLDVSRYLGRWHEIAKFPNRFQKKCASDTTADYALRPDGSIAVLNQCRRADGEWEIAKGQARQIGGSRSAKLEVRFAPAWLSFVPWVWGDYWIVDLDEGYELVAISEPTREYLWVLSRSPVVAPSRYATLLTRLSALGLDVGRLEKSPHSNQ